MTSTAEGSILRVETVFTRDRGLTLLHGGPDATVDIVFIHGLQGHPEKTWAKQIYPGNSERLGILNSVLGRRKRDRSVTEKGAQSVFWPRDLLPLKYPKARILTYGYDSHISHFFKGPANQNGITEHGRDMLQALVAYRRTTPDKPIVFVAHSLGGLILKECLWRSSRAGGAEGALRTICISTIGVAFFGTPHRGGAAPYVSWGTLATNIAKVAGFDASRKILRELEVDSGYLEILRDEFQKIVHERKILIHTFQESYGVKGIRGLNGKVVDAISSGMDDPTYEQKTAIDSNHMDMCRFVGPEDDGYIKFCGNAMDRFIEKIGEPPTQNVLLTPNPSSDETNISALNIEKLRASLSHPDLFYREDTIGQEHPGTFSWIWDDSLGFEAWLRGRNGIYWISGLPASGKSTLMKRVLRHDLTTQILRGDGSSTTVTASFFFYDGGSKNQKSLLGLLLCILGQIIEQAPLLAQIIQPVFNKLRTIDGKRTWNLVSLQDALQRICEQRKFRTDICLFIDALDEYEGDYISIAKFFLGLSKPASYTQIQMCLSSRREQAFVVQFANVPGFEIEKYTRSDMRKYVRDTLDINIPGYTWVVSDGQTLALDDIVSYIVDHAKGVFLWTKLVSLELLDGACHFDTPEQLWRILEGIPTEITELYRRILHKIPERYAYQAYVMLETVKCADSPPEWAEFGFVVETEAPGTLSCRSKSDDEIPDYYYTWLIDRGKEVPQSWHAQIFARCRGLLKITETYNRSSEAHVEFLHRTVKDFMDGGQHQILLQKKIRSIVDGHLYHCRALLRLWRFVAHWSKSPSIRIIDQCETSVSDMAKSIDHIFEKKFVDNFPHREARWGDYDYIWGFHTRKVDAIDPGSLELLLQKFCSNNTVFQYWWAFVTDKCKMWSIPDPDQIGRQDILAVFYGLVRYLELRNDTGLASINRGNTIPLLEYGIKGFGCNFHEEHGEESWFDELVKLLLKVGLDPTETIRMQGALFLLAWYGLERVNGLLDIQFHWRFGISGWNGLQTLINSGMDPNRPLVRLKLRIRHGDGQEWLFDGGVIGPIEFVILTHPPGTMLEALEYLNEKGATISDIDHNALFCAFGALIDPVICNYYKSSLINCINFLLDHGGRFSREFTAIMPLLDEKYMRLNKRWLDPEWYDNNVWSPDSKTWDNLRSYVETCKTNLVMQGIIGMTARLYECSPLDETGHSATPILQALHWKIQWDNDAWRG